MKLGGMVWAAATKFCIFGIGKQNYATEQNKTLSYALFYLFFCGGSIDMYHYNGHLYFYKSDKSGNGTLLQYFNLEVIIWEEFSWPTLTCSVTPSPTSDDS